MAVGAFVNAEIEKRGTMISEKRASEISEKSNRVAGGFSPPAPTTRSMRVRTARFT
jgi:hypothetical protein